MDDWGNDGIEALKLRLVRTKEQCQELTEEEQDLVKDFSPLFVYPIFGVEETIFGYHNLQIQLQFASGSLSQYLNVTYDAKFADSGDVTADDPEKILYEFIPPSYSKSCTAFEARVQADSEQFRPAGVLLASYKMRSASTNGSKKVEGKGKGKAKVNGPERSWEILPLDQETTAGVSYVAYKSDWSTPGFKEFHRKMQIFVLLFIEGARYLDEDDERWEFITLFERRKIGSVESFHYCGFASFYTFFCWPDTKRIRLAQFVILPPYQSQGHGSALYTIAYRHILARPEISELTVEDPSETFEDMRDKSDLQTLMKDDALQSIKAPINKQDTELIRKRYKLADRQFYRLLEMILLLKLDTTVEEEVKAYRLLVKRRLYLFNKEMLTQVTPDERKTKLQETYEALQDDYRRLTSKFA